MEALQKRLDDHVKFLSGFEKLSGSSNAHRAVEYITNVLKNYHVSYNVEQFPAYLSNPLSSTLMLDDGTVLKSRPRSFSKNVPDGIKGAAVYDDNNCSKALTPAETEKLYESFKGKIVVSHGYDELYAKLMENNGALGWIQIWESDEDEIHEDTVSSVWGTPDLDSSLMLLHIPVICVNKKTGDRLIQYLKDGERDLYMSACVDTRVFKVEVPVAEIKGKTDDFVLVSGHYDTWFAGAMDNVTANAACLEIAKMLQEHENELYRSVRIAWWAGHSNGRYMGSAWYCDHYFNELKKKCIAHVNSDLIGSQKGKLVAVITTGLEDEKETIDMIRKIDADAPIQFKRFGRGADQSFWGTEIPYNIMTRYEALPEEKDTAAPGGSAWWHTVEDTYEKVDMHVLEKETKIFYENVKRFACREVVSAEFHPYFEKMRKTLESVDAASDPEFVFSDLYQRLGQLEKMITERMEAVSEQSRMKLVKITGGKMNWLMQTYGSPYGQDLAYAYGMFPHLTAVKNIYRENTSEKEFLFYMTEFVRQKNRFMEETEELMEKIQRME